MMNLDEASNGWLMGWFTVNWFYHIMEPMTNKWGAMELRIEWPSDFWR
jgi:hypothetical protein